MLHCYVTNVLLFANVYCKIFVTDERESWGHKIVVQQNNVENTID